MARGKEYLSCRGRPKQHPCPRCEAAFQHAGSVVSAFMNGEADQPALLEAFKVLRVALATQRAGLGPAPVRPGRRVYRVPR
jgi:hypothetical protein